MCFLPDNATVTQPFPHRITVAILDLCGPLEMRTVWFSHRSEEISLRARGGLGNVVCSFAGAFEAITAGVALASWAGTTTERLRGDERSGIGLGGSCLDIFVVVTLLVVVSVFVLSFASKFLLAKEDVCRWQYSFPLQATAA